MKPNTDLLGPAFMSSPTPTLVVRGADGVVVAVNDECARTVAVRAGEHHSALAAVASDAVAHRQLTSKTLWLLRVDGRLAATGATARAFDVDALAHAVVTLDLAASSEPGELTQQADLVHSTEGPFRLLVAATEEYAIFMLDPEGRVVTWNLGAERIKGYTATEVLGRHFSMFYTAEDQARGHPRSELDRALADGRYVEDGWRVRKDGSTFWARVTLTPLRDTSGSLIGFGKVTHDLSDHVAAAEQLSLSEARLRLLVEGNSDGYMLRDHQSRRLLYANPAIHRITGMTTEQIADAGPALVSTFVDPADLGRLQAELSGPGPWETEVLMHLPAGSRTMRMRSVDLTDATHTWSALVLEDVTDRHQAAQQLADTEERFTQLMASLSDAYVVLGVDPTEILYASPNIEQVLGLTAESFTREPALLRHLVHPDDLSAMTQAWLSSTSKGFELEFRLLRHDGNAAWIRSRYWPIKMEADRAVRVGAVFEDITSRKRIQGELRSAQEAAERANSAKNDFLSRMSHELRTPLNAVLGFAQLLLSEQLEPEQADSVEHILVSGEHLLNLINDVLDISRIESGQLEISSEPVRLLEVVDEAIDLLRPLADAAGVSVVVAPGSDRATAVMADRQRFRQVLINLLSNAIKYNRHGGHVQVRGWQSGPEVSLAVTDTGLGIAHADLPRLFTPFERLGGHREIEGVGVGLALSLQLAVLMGGQLIAQSTPGEGSTFTLVLPAAQAGVGAAASPRDARRSAPARHDHSSTPFPVDGRTGDLTLLSIEDNVSNIRLLERIVARRPRWRLVHSATGAEGLEHVRDEGPDLVLLDLHLPDMGGGDVLRRIRSDPATQALAVIMLSADATQTQISRMREAGATDYLTKPVEVQTILDLLDAFAERR